MLAGIWEMGKKKNQRTLEAREQRRSTVQSKGRGNTEEEKRLSSGGALKLIPSTCSLSQTTFLHLQSRGKKKKKLAYSAGRIKGVIFILQGKHTDGQ